MYVDGNRIQQELKTALAAKAAACSVRPALAVVRVGDDLVSRKFTERKQRFGEEAGVRVALLEFDQHITTKALQKEIAAISAREEFQGVIVQLPLPDHINTQKILDTVPLEKDVDVLSEEAVSAFARGALSVLPPVAGAVKEILARAGIDPKTRSAVVIGRGRLVGVPVATWLCNEGAVPDVIDVRTPDAASVIAEADLIISGAGTPGLIKPESVKQGVVIIDAGTSTAGGELHGDVDPSVEEKASVFTPVPGGIGPVTVAKLFENLFDLYEAQQ